MTMAVQSFGAGLKSHVHYHILIGDGVWFPGGSYYSILLIELRLRFSNHW